FVAELVTSVGIAELEEAEAVLYGTIASYSLTPVSYTKSDVNQEYRLTVVISVRIEQKDTGKILWEDHAITDYEDFAVNISNVSATREAEEQALKKLAKDTSRNVKEKLLEGF
ncbi:MAG: LPS assembly lipoprotein LptE, partial [Deltaproteobacteria bacterium]